MVGRRAAWRGVAAAAFFACAVVLGAGASRADPTMIDVSDQSIVIVQHTQGLRLQTWDRDQILVDTGSGPAPVTEKRPYQRASPIYPVQIPAATLPANQADGGPAIQLGPEEFPVSIPPGTHDTVRVQLPAAPATVFIPANTAVLSINGSGPTFVQDYHGQLIAQQRFGPLVLRNLGGVAFVQNLRGQLYVADSTFDRLRTRTGLQGMIFQRCSVREIEASSVRGSITYDDGTFVPGLARFETTSGHIALGIDGGASVGVKGAPGQVYQSFDRPATFIDRNGEATATLRGGGPLVNVVTQQGKVYLYDGAIGGKRALPPQWESVRAPVQRIEQQLRAAGGRREQPLPQGAPLRPRREPLRRVRPDEKPTARTSAAPPRRA